MPTGSVGIPLVRGASDAAAMNPTLPKEVKAWEEGPLRPKEISRCRDTLGRIRTAVNTTDRSVTRQLKMCSIRILPSESIISHSNIVLEEWLIQVSFGLTTIIILYRKLKYDPTTKWFNAQKQSIIENDMNKIPWDFEIPADLLILTWRRDLVIINKSENLPSTGFTVFRRPEGKSKKKWPVLRSCQRTKKVLEPEGDGDLCCNLCDWSGLSWASYGAGRVGD